MEPTPSPDDKILFSALEDFEADERRAAEKPAAAAPTGGGAQGGTAPAEFAMNMSALLKELANVENPEAQKVADDVQSSISKTLASLAESAKKLDEQVSSGAGADSDALLEKVFEQFNSNTEFQNMMENMVQQLMSKDIMYGPLKEMKEKYPDWLQKNGATLSSADLARYQKQAMLISNICELYEREPADMQQIMTLMQEMQECGQPPQDIIKELAPDATPDSTNSPTGADPNCAVM